MNHTSSIRHGLRTSSLRLTNCGRRQLIKHNRQSFIGWLIRLAVETEIQLYGGSNDCAEPHCVDGRAFLRAGALTP